MGRRPRAIEAREQQKQRSSKHGCGEGGVEAHGAEPLTACLEGERGGGAATWPHRLAAVDGSPLCVRPLPGPGWRTPPRRAESDESSG